jgi:penicillin-binding protein 1A
LLQSLGIKKAINYVTRFGFDKNTLAADLSLALGTHALTPLQLVTAYASLANGGYRVEPYFIERIEDINGSVVYEAMPKTVCSTCDQEDLSTYDEKPVKADEELSMEAILSEPGAGAPLLPKAERVMDGRVAYIIDSILKDVIQKGTGKRARVLKRKDIAGKTGTTNGPIDAWFSGYNPDIAASAWLGFDQNNLLGKREYGGSAALPIWIDYMRTALKGYPDRARPTPPLIVTTRIDEKTGLLALPGQKNAIFEVFRSEYAPTEMAAPPTQPKAQLIENEETEILY